MPHPTEFDDDVPTLAVPFRPVPARTVPLVVVKPLMSCADVARLVGVSKRTLWRMVASGDFPAPVRWNRKLVKWPAGVVVGWLRQQDALVPAADVQGDDDPEREARLRELERRAAAREELFAGR
jgi:predicted DNA-binding transcriptional regulator AlpA